MTLTYDPNPSAKYPHGYWHATTGDHDAVGLTPLDAVTALALTLNAVLRAVRGS